jgi:hypothetical protein
MPKYQVDLNGETPIIRVKAVLRSGDWMSHHSTPMLPTSAGATLFLELSSPLVVCNAESAGSAYAP